NAADKRGITEKDLFDFVWIGDPQISPDGTNVVFVRVTVNEKKLGYDTAIWTVSTSGSDPTRRLSTGPHDGSPRWSPDGKFLTFLRATEKDGKPEPPQLAMGPLPIYRKAPGRRAGHRMGRRLRLPARAIPRTLRSNRRKKKRKKKLRKRQQRVLRPVPQPSRPRSRRKRPRQLMNARAMWWS
ncbi:MAG: hypothetical protein DMF04_11335, partial [Verrucomicrobia bacterium]